MMQQAASEIITQLLRTPAYRAASDRAIPAAFHAPNEGDHPTFIQVDFAVTRDAQGKLRPKLIELQGCARSMPFSSSSRRRISASINCLT